MLPFPRSLLPITRRSQPSIGSKTRGPEVLQPLAQATLRSEQLPDAQANGFGHCSSPRATSLYWPPGGLLHSTRGRPVRVGEEEIHGFAAWPYEAVTWNCRRSSAGVWRFLDV